MSDDENTSWQYKHDESDAVATAEQDQPAADESDDSATRHASSGLSWTGPEYVEHERSAGWYCGLVLTILIIAALFYFLTKDYFAVGATIAAGIIVGIHAKRKPNQVQYELSNKGLKIGQKFYPYSTFKSFSVAPEGKLSSANFQPIKRIMSPLAIYFEAQNEQKVTEVIGEHLPYDRLRMDPIDRFTSRLRF
jgi:hypothetical protein